jgi:hypothetical protein
MLWNGITNKIRQDDPVLSLQAAPAKWPWQSSCSRSWQTFSDQKEKHTATLLTTYIVQLLHVRETVKKEIGSNLGHCLNRKGGRLRIKLIFQSICEIFREIPVLVKTLWNFKVINLVFFLLNIVTPQTEQCTSSWPQGKELDYVEINRRSAIKDDKRSKLVLANGCTHPPLCFILGELLLIWDRGKILMSNIVYQKLV